MCAAVDSSDSDDFYDAQQDIGPAKSSSSPLFITDDVEDVCIIEVKNPNSPCKSGADLSLEHLMQSNSERTIIVVDDAAPPQNQQSLHLKAADDVPEDLSTTEENLQISVEIPLDHDLEDDREKSQVNLVATVISTPATAIESHPDQTLLDEIPNKNHEKPVDELQNDPSVTKVESYHDIIDTSSKPEPENLSEASSNRSSYHQPDIVASIKERPSDLPGVQSFQLPAGQIISTEQKKPLSHAPHPSPARPKRPPPPRPKAPPKRPPLPKGAPPPSMKPLLGSADDALLTPNSAVDNITREFAAALGGPDARRVEEKPLGSPPTERTPPSKPSTPADTPKRKDPPPKRRSLSRKLSNQSGSGRLDEGRQWSEMRKETVLTIDSSPGLEILSTVIVRNLDTGQTMPLSVAAEQVSQCLNPLALQIMSRTKEFACAGAEEQVAASHKPQTPEHPPSFSRASLEEDSLSVASDEITIGADAASNRTFSDGGRKLKFKSKKFKSLIGKGARRVKEAAGSQMERAVHKVKHSKGESATCDSLNVSSDEDAADSMTNSFVKTKVSSSNKDAHHFARPKLVQDIAVHVGAVWSMKFSHCGRLLATAGQNNVIWVWVLKDYFAFFNNLRSKYDSKERGTVFATPPRNSMDPPSSQEDAIQERSGSVGGSVYSASDEADEEEDAPFRSLPFSSYVGHTADVLDLAWSKNYFTLSSSMDKTVRLWHVSQKECLCCFQHIDFVTAISFHPKDDRYFLSGSLDSKLRLWNIPDKKVALWNEISPDSSSGSSSGGGGGALITTVNFCENGKYAVCGTYDGRCMFYDTEHLKYHTQIHVRSSRGRNNKGHKITGIEPLPGEKKILVTSNDSRVRLYDLRDLSLTCKFKGLTNLSSQIKASFSHDSKYIICGSEDKSVYIWRTNPPQDVTKLSSFRRDRNDAWESIRAHDAVVTCAIFAPFPHLMARNSEKSESGSKTSLLPGKKSAAANSYIISADFNGLIKVFSNSQRK